MRPTIESNTCRTGCKGATRSIPVAGYRNIVGAYTQAGRNSKVTIYIKSILQHYTACAGYRNTTE